MPQQYTAQPTLELFRRFAPWVIGAGVVGALAGLGVSQATSPTYAATSTLYFSINFGASGTDLNQGAAYTQSQMLSFAELAESERVLGPVAESLELDESVSELAARIDASTPSNTVVLDITAQSGDALVAAAIADAVAESLTDAVNEVAPRDSEDRSTVSVRTVQSAEIPTVPVAPNVRVNVVAGAVLGIALALLTIFVVRRLDTRVGGGDSVEAAGAAPVLGRVQREPVGELVLTADPNGEGAERYRRLAAILLGSSQPSDHPTVVVLTSPTRGGSSTSTAANLAIAAAQNGRPVTLYSQDARSLTGVPESVRVRDLAETSHIDDAVGLAIVDAPDLVSSSLAIRHGQSADGVVVVADVASTHVGELAAAVEQLSAAGVTLAGTVLVEPASHRDRSAESTRRRTSSLPVLEHHEA